MIKKLHFNIKFIKSYYLFSGVIQELFSQREVAWGKQCL